MTACCVYFQFVLYRDFVRLPNTYTFCSSTWILSGTVHFFLNVNRQTILETSPYAIGSSDIFNDFIYFIRSLTSISECSQRYFRIPRSLFVNIWNEFVELFYVLSKVCVCFFPNNYLCNKLRFYINDVNKSWFQKSFYQ